MQLSRRKERRPAAVDQVDDLGPRYFLGYAFQRIDRGEAIDQREVRPGPMKLFGAQDSLLYRRGVGASNDY
jgi:hypothetical protein